MNLRAARFRPRLIDALEGYNRAHFFTDLSAGLTVGIVALPLAMAFAIASGVKPEAGIFTAIIAGFIISALGGSRVQIGGPAGAFIVVVYGIIERYGLANLLIATILAGLLLFAMGFFRIGNLIRYIPIAVVIGFTNGIAVLIALSQVRTFFGLDVDKLPSDFFSQLGVLWNVRATADWPSFLLGTLSLALLVLWPRLARRSAADVEIRVGRFGRQFAARWRERVAGVPGPVIVLVIGTSLVALLDLKVETVGSRFGGIPQGLPAFAMPLFSWELVKQLFAPTITIALLSAIESLLCARVSDSITGERHDPNQELMAQGIANVVTPFFGGIPATGTMARTVTNIRAGATSPVSGIIHALVLLAIVLFAAPLANNIPLAALAAILLYVAYNMGEWHEFPKLRQFPVPYRIIVVATFLLTIILDVSVAVEVGVVLACVFFVYRIASLTQIEALTTPDLPTPLPAGVAAYRIFGSLFFGAVSKLEKLADPQADTPRVMIFELHQMINIDTSGLAALEAVHRKLKRAHGRLILVGLNPQPASFLLRSRFIDRLGGENLVADLAGAIALSEEFVAAPAAGESGHK